jgi:hypothetical protein
MIEFIERLRIASWKFNQPLARLPLNSRAVVSDLFIWRKSDEYNTFFEILSLPSIFEDLPTSQARVTIVIFNLEGEKILEESISFCRYFRNTICVSDIIPAGSGTFGTFSVFHSYIPESLESLGSFLCERGYVAYKYKDMPLHSYCHGNLDAIACLDDQRLQLLGATSIRSRIFNLQYNLTATAHYDLALVNPTQKSQKITLSLISSSGTESHSHIIKLSPRASYIFNLPPRNESFRAVIKSKLVMARPLVFKVSKNMADVFHG